MNDTTNVGRRRDINNVKDVSRQMQDISLFMLWMNI